LDGDGDQDVLSASRNDDKIFWFENEDGLGDFGTEQIITTNTDAPYATYASDIDGDGDLDILSASLQDVKIAWYENEDGMGNFGEQQIIATDTGNPYSVYAADLDGDGDQDVIYSSLGFDRIVWHKNEDGLGNFSSELIITNSTDAPSSVYAIDLDGDGDQDVLSASFGDNKIAWYENQDGLGNFGLQQVISLDAMEATSVFATDIDSDGDIDVLSASSEDGKIAWYENLGIIESYSFPDLLELKIEVYPNPTTGYLQIESPSVISQIEIYNALGQVVLGNTNQSAIDLRGLANGFYFCKVKSVEGYWGVRKVMRN